MRRHHSTLAALGLALSLALGAASGAGAQEQWQYGTHPVLGLSAHVDLEDGGAIGLACRNPVFNPIQDSFVAIRMTGDLTVDGNFVMLFDGAGDYQTLQAEASTPGNGYSEWGGNTCMTAVDAFKRANALVTTPARIVSFGGWAEDQYVDFELKPLSGQAFQASGFAELPERRAISLRGSSAAINSLIAACPSMRIDIEQNCGI